MERWQQFILDWIRDPSDRAGARRDLEALFVFFAESIVMSRCQGPGDILVVEDWGTAADIAGKAKSPCHNHQILIRADYERAVREAEDMVWEEAKKEISDLQMLVRRCVMKLPEGDFKNVVKDYMKRKGIGIIRPMQSTPEPRGGRAE